MTSVSFQWSIDVITPRLQQAVGSISLYWALIEWQFIRICEDFHRLIDENEKLPRAFDRRADIVLDDARSFYAKEYPDEPSEFRQFSWFMQRLKSANGRRDAVIHGMPGKVTKNGRTYDGIHVPFPSQSAKQVSISLEDIYRLDVEIWQLYAETCRVSLATSRAISAASPDTIVEQTPDGYVQLTKANRSPKLAQEPPPPPTFQA